MFVGESLQIPTKESSRTNTNNVHICYWLKYVNITLNTNQSKQRKAQRCRTWEPRLKPVIFSHSNSCCGVRQVNTVQEFLQRAHAEMPDARRPPLRQETFGVPVGGPLKGDSWSYQQWPGGRVLGYSPHKLVVASDLQQQGRNSAAFVAIILIAATNYVLLNALRILIFLCHDGFVYYTWMIILVASYNIVIIHHGYQPCISKLVI